MRANSQSITTGPSDPTRTLPGWPAAEKIDGSAHIVGDRGLIFLFNPSKTALTGEFDLTDESIGLKAAGNFQILKQIMSFLMKLLNSQEKFKD